MLSCSLKTCELEHLECLVFVLEVVHLVPPDGGAHTTPGPKHVPLLLLVMFENLQFVITVFTILNVY